MTHAQALEKAINYAIERGFNILFDDWKVAGTGKLPHIEGTYRGEWLLKDFQTIIFNHDFAKALWGEGYEPDLDLFEYPSEFKFIDGMRQYMTVNDQRLWDSRKSGWQYHLQQMVIAPDFIKYLGAHLPE